MQTETTGLQPASQPQSSTEAQDEQDLSDLLQELRILLQGSQVLTAFLIILPFQQGFAQIDQMEKWVYVATFLCSISSLVLFSAPAAQHRLERPLPDKVPFKQQATRTIILGLIPLSLALILVTHLVIVEVIGAMPGLIAAAFIAVVIALLWWLLPMARKKNQHV